MDHISHPHTCLRCEVKPGVFRLSKIHSQQGDFLHLLWSRCCSSAGSDWMGVFFRHHTALKCFSWVSVFSFNYTRQPWGRLLSQLSSHFNMLWKKDTSQQLISAMRGDVWEQQPHWSVMSLSYYSGGITSMSNTATRVKGPHEKKNQGLKF